MIKRHFSFRNLVILTVSLVVVAIFSVSVNPVLASRVEEAKLRSIGIAIDQIKQFLNLAFFFNSSQPLNNEEIIFWTNEARIRNGESNLVEDPKLDLVAQKRLRDMIEKQYFDHYNPQGRGISDEAEALGYEFIAIGENLAQGDFKDSEALVAAWMKSPGHKENILKSQYSKIGIAAQKVVFEGKNTWLVVQAFSRPLSECVEPSKQLKNLIEENKEELQESLDQANEIFLEMTKLQNRGETNQYNELVPVYNSLVKKVNDKTDELQRTISKYNQEVAGFNYCLEN